VEWLSETHWLWWVGAAVLFGLVEVGTLHLVFVMLSVASLCAAAAAWLGASVTVTVLVFAGVSILLLWVARPLALRALQPARPAQRTGAAALVGRRAVVLETVTDRSGRVKLAREVWSARTDEAGRRFEVDDVVEVTVIDGATAVVGEPSLPPSRKDQEA
jgi:membrane protein implicated in regulation of membrane protease activity